MKMLKNDYSLESEKLAQLAGCGTADNLPPYLDSIYQVTEAKWEENIQRLVRNNVKIKYLMFGEAAPQTTEGEVSYFYNNCHGNWCKAIVEGIIPWRLIPANIEDKFEELARRQFLLVDTMPFALDYSAAKRRYKVAYKELVHLCANSYLCNKLFDDRLRWEDEIKVAFGVKKNAEAMMAAFPNGFTLPNGQVIKFSFDMVATTAANYPSAGRVREVFEIKA
jgi:hypothetical protein